MPHPYDQIDHRLILALRAGHDAEISATLAHYTRGAGRKYHIEHALEAADKVTAAAEAPRAEIASYELEAAQAKSEVGDGVASIAAERQRQKDVEGWTPEHDDAHGSGEMAGAAACYALNGVMHWARQDAIARFWPWDAKWWKPKDRRTDLVRAGALIAAEIDRLDRAKAKGEQS